MEKEKEKLSAIDIEIRSYEAKLKEMKKGYEKTIHDFANGIVIYLIIVSHLENTNSKLYKKQTEGLQKLNFSTSKVIKAPESCLYK
jgi:hypothetical protein